jgi:hypothetical protein
MAALRWSVMFPSCVLPQPSERHYCVKVHAEGKPERWCVMFQSCALSIPNENQSCVISHAALDREIPMRWCDMFPPVSFPSLAIAKPVSLPSEKKTILNQFRVSMPPSGSLSVGVSRFPPVSFPMRMSACCLSASACRFPACKEVLPAGNCMLCASGGSSRARYVSRICTYILVFIIFILLYFNYTTLVV